MCGAEECLGGSSDTPVHLDIKSLETLHIFNKSCRQDLFPPLP